MRKSKLTLTADPSIIETAKRLAAARNTSVSALFSRLIESMQAEEETGIDGVGPLTRKASGLVSLPGWTFRSHLAIDDRIHDFEDALQFHSAI